MGAFQQRQPRTTEDSGIVMKSIVASLICGICLLSGPTAASAAESLSCAGSTLCGKIGLPNGDQCNAAKRTIQTNNRYFTGGGAGSTGVCDTHCGLFVSGSNCDLFGSEMNQAFDQLRSYGCMICGVKTFDDGCQFKMDYVTSC